MQTLLRSTGLWRLSNWRRFFFICIAQRKQHISYLLRLLTVRSYTSSSWYVTRYSRQLSILLVVLILEKKHNFKKLTSPRIRLDVLPCICRNLSPRIYLCVFVGAILSARYCLRAVVGALLSCALLSMNQTWMGNEYEGHQQCSLATKTVGSQMLHRHNGYRLNKRDIYCFLLRCGVWYSIMFIFLLHVKTRLKSAIPE